MSTDEPDPERDDDDDDDDESDRADGRPPGRAADPRPRVEAPLVTSVAVVLLVVDMRFRKRPSAMPAMPATAGLGRIPKAARRADASAAASAAADESAAAEAVAAELVAEYDALAEPLAKPLGGSKWAGCPAMRLRSSPDPALPPRTVVGAALALTPVTEVLPCDPT